MNLFSKYFIKHFKTVIGFSQLLKLSSCTVDLRMELYWSYEPGTYLRENAHHGELFRNQTALYYFCGIQA
jgi:hypothetical protein